MASNNFRAQAQPVDEERQAHDALVKDFIEDIIPQENILLKYDATSWTSKLYGLSARDFKKYQSNSNDYTEMVIAETGATGKYNIDEIVMTSIPPGTHATKNSTMLYTVITMSESGSMTFFDDLHAASLMLGYSKLIDIPLFLEIGFKGFDQYATNEPVTIPGSTRTWGLRINKIETRIDGAGTTVYDITLAPLVYQTYSDEWRLSEQIELIATRDVKSFIESFSKKLNSIVNTQYGYLTYMFPSDLQSDNFFTFHVHPKIGALSISSTSQDTATDKSATGAGSKRFVFEAKQTISNVIDMIMDSAEITTNNSDTKKRQFVHVIPVSKYVGYDRFRQKHVYRYDVYVFPYSAVDYQDVDDTRNANTAWDFTRLVKEAHPNTKFNMKQYDYQWSGLNTEVLDLDFDFNQSYAMIANKNVTGLYDQKNRTGTKASDIKPQDPIASSAELQKLYLRLEELKSIDNRTGEQETELLNSSLKLQENVAFEGESDQLQRHGSNTPIYLENATRSLDLVSYVGANNSSDMKVIVPVDYQNNTEVSSNTDDSNSTPTEVANRLIRSNYYNDGFLLKIDVTVRGDTYWLGKSDRDLIRELENVVNGDLVDHDVDHLTVNTINCEPMFLLNLHPARGYSEATNEVVTDKSGIFRQAVYRVLKIESTFDRAGFHQQLNAGIYASTLNRSK